MKNIILLAAALLLTTTVSACNTVEGAGKDMSKAGTEVQDEAREHKNGDAD